MNWKKLFGFGILLYALMFLFWSILMSFGVSDAVWAWPLALIVLAFLVHCIAHKLHTKNLGKLLGYSVGWAIIMALLDYFISMRFTGPVLFQMWETYAAYAIIVLVPLVSMHCPCHKNKKMES